MNQFLWARPRALGVAVPLVDPVRPWKGRMCVRVCVVGIELPPLETVEGRQNDTP